LEFLDGEKRFRLGNTPRNAVESDAAADNFDDLAGLVNNARFDDATVAWGFGTCNC
jgi:hypothetical protein